jgi:molybdopterin-guanine dinucleotide biosynthesis protein A
MDILYFCGKLQILGDKDEITGIVLAGGKSTRMGEDKGLMELNNKPLIDYSIEVLSKVCDELIIGANSLEYQRFGFPVIPDEIKGIGPIGGIFSCLKASLTQDNVVLSCDIPLITQPVVELLLSKRKDYQIVVPVVNGFPEPLCAYYHSSVINGLHDLINRDIYKLQYAIKQFRTKFLPLDSKLSFYNEMLFSNINSSKDLIQNVIFLMKVNAPKGHSEHQIESLRKAKFIACRDESGELSSNK